jgi:glutaredoxin
MKIELLSRQDCGLCDHAADALRALGLTFSTVDVDSDPELVTAFGDAVPVVLVAGQEVTRAPITLDSLRRALSGLALTSG